MVWTSNPTVRRESDAVCNECRVNRLLRFGKTAIFRRFRTNRITIVTIIIRIVACLRVITTTGLRIRHRSEDRDSVINSSHRSRSLVRGISTQRQYSSSPHLHITHTPIIRTRSIQWWSKWIIKCRWICHLVTNKSGHTQRRTSQFVRMLTGIYLINSKTITFQLQQHHIYRLNVKFITFTRSHSLKLAV